MKVEWENVNTVRKRLADGTIRIYYYHRPTGTRLPDDPKSAEFAERLTKLNAGAEGKSGAPVDPRSFEALIRLYKAAPEYRQLNEKTKKDYVRYLEIVRELWGALAVAKLERKHILKLRDRYADKPRTANYLMQVLRRLLNFAIDRGFRTDNPAQRPGTLRTGPGHKPWPDWLIQAFRENAEPHVREAMEVLLYTGQRQSDAIAMTVRDRQDGGIKVIQEKTGAELWIAEHEDLTAFLEGRPENRKHFLLITTKSGRQWKLDHLRHEFRRTILALDADGFTIHGLRHTAGAKLAEAGCTESEIMAILGHVTPEMARHYVRQANQKRLAKSAMRKWKAGPQEQD